MAGMKLPALPLLVLALPLAACSTADESQPAPAPAPAAQPAPAPAATADADPEARAIAEHVLDEMGGREAWARTRVVRWTFMGLRRHFWDRATGDVRIEAGPRVVLMNLKTRDGEVYEGGVRLPDPAAERKALEEGYAWWVNDAYWMFMPYKLLDPGVKLAYGGEAQLPDGREADVLKLTFEGVGLTPKDRYEVLVGRDTGLVEAWSYSPDPEKPLVPLGVWADWKRYGGVLLAGSHGRGLDWKIAVYDEPPAGVFTDPGPTDA